MRPLVASLAIAGAALLAACASPASLLTEQEAAELREPLECEAAAECDVLWRRVQVWIARNSAYKIQTANDAVIQTYGTGGASIGWAFSATREPLGKGRERIKLDASCGSYPALCGKTRAQIEARFLGDMRSAR